MEPASGEIRLIEPRWRWAGLAMLLALITDTTVLAQPPGIRPNRPHDPNRTEPLTFVLRAGGFGLDRIQVPAGKYRIAVYNRTGTENVPVTFERATGQGVPPQGELIRNASTDIRTSRFVEKATLQRGTYRLRVPNRGARWTLTIDVN